MAVTRQRLTLDEFLALPEEEPALEYEDGKVTQKVSPKGQHSGLQADLTELFNRFARPRRLARAFTELRTTFAGASRVPDIAVYGWERVPRNEAGEIATTFSSRRTSPCRSPRPASASSGLCNAAAHTLRRL